MPIGLLIALALLAPTLSASCIAHLEVPKYPEIARLSRVEGAITVDVSIGADGKVVSTTASGVAMLREAAEENAKHWTFQPGHAATLRIVYQFRLEKAEVTSSARSDVVFDLPDRVLVLSHPQKLDHIRPSK